MMKKLTVFLVSLMAVVFSALTARADYGYKVTVSGGLYNNTNFVLENVPYGTRFNPSDYGLAVLEPNTSEEAANKYYFKGYHISGVEVESPEDYVSSIVVTKDVTLVATYGIKGKTVPYTAKFVDTEGKEIADPEVYYGNIGDKPVVTFRYIEGYRPDTYNIRGTLKASGNEFTFTYKKVVKEETKKTETASRVDGVTYSADENSIAYEPKEIVDLDDAVETAGATAQQAKAAAPEMVQKKRASVFAKPAVITGGLSVIALILLGIALIKSRKEEKE